MNSFCDVMRFQEGIWAIALHNLSTKLTGASIDITNAPSLVTLLLLADGLQCWDRQYFRQEKDQEIRKPIPSHAVGLECKNNVMYWLYDKNYAFEPGFINASYEAIVIKECASFITEEDVKRIIKKGY